MGMACQGPEWAEEWLNLGETERRVKVVAER